MFLACGIGAYQAAVFMVVAHACYKGTLFLGAGSVIHGNHDNQDLRTMGGLRRFMPLTALAFVLAWLAIIGIPPLSGFFAKDEIISDAFYAHDYGLWIVALAGAAVTGLYMTRETLLTFFGNERFRAALGADPVDGEEQAGTPEPAAVAAAAPESEVEHHGTHEISPISPTVDYGTPAPAPALTEDPHEMPWTMVLPSLVLATLAVVIGFINLPFHDLEFLTDWLDPVFTGVEDHGPDSFVQGASLELLAVVIALVGITIGWTLYRRGLADADADPLDRRLGPVARVFGNAYYFDSGIGRLVGGPIRWAATWLSNVFDLKIIDGAVNGLARLFRGAGTGLRRLQTGLVRQYALGIVLGVVLLLLYALARVGI
jgi:NADH-quinone oxidoreductase subunit L